MSSEKRIDPIEYLGRDDKWYLGGGTGTVYAPKFPKWPFTPGFWDEGYHADLKIERMFTLFVLDESGKLIHLQAEDAWWQPHALTQNYHATGLLVTEEKLVTAEHAFISRLTFLNQTAAPRKLHLLQWGLQDRKKLMPNTVDDALTDAQVTENAITWTQRFQYIKNSGELYLALSASLPRSSYSLNLSELTDTGPNWWVSMFPEKFQDGKLPNETKLDVGWNSFGYVHMAQHYELEVPANGEASAVFTCAANFDRQAAEANAIECAVNDVVERSYQRWQAFFESVPYFESDNGYLTKYYWYRWYGLRLMTVDLKHHPYQYPCVMEGIDMFRCYITYSAQVHMREAAWMHDPALAEGSLLGEIHNQEPSGSFKGHIYSLRPERGFYHANWGANALHIYAVHQNKGFLEAIYAPLARYAEYFQRERDKENSHLYDIINQDETGQEYMSRYLFVDEHADEWGAIQLKGVDSTYYLYELQKALATMADILGSSEGDRWRCEAAQTKDAILGKMWNSEMNFFCDVRPADGAHSPMKSACCFYPFWGDLAGKEHLPMIYGHLLNPEEFWTEWPVPASSVDDPYFNAQGEWKGKRTRCPWNGRVWPMTNSHIAEALASAARTLDPNLRKTAAEFTEKFIKLMFYDRDPERPNCFEHYNPFTGTPCLYRGIDDYQHSWVVDLILTQVVGLLPSLENKLILDPLPFDTAYFECDRLRYKGHDVRIKWDANEGLTVWVDGQQKAHAKERERIEIEMSAED